MSGLSPARRGAGRAPGEPGIYYKGTRNYLRIVPRDTIQAAAILKTMKADGCTKAAVANDKDTYGIGLAALLVLQRSQYGIPITSTTGLDPKQPNYTALYNKIKGLKPDAIFLGTIIDNNGSQLVKDKVAVLGPNSGVKLIGPDGMNVNDLPTSKDAGSTAEGMYLTTAGLRPDQLEAGGGAAVYTGSSSTPS